MKLTAFTLVLRYVSNLIVALVAPMMINLFSSLVVAFLVLACHIVKLFISFFLGHTHPYFMSSSTQGSSSNL